MKALPWILLAALLGFLAGSPPAQAQSRDEVVLQLRRIADALERRCR